MGEMEDQLSDKFWGGQSYANTRALSRQHDRIMASMASSRPSVNIGASSSIDGTAIGKLLFIGIGGIAAISGFFAGIEPYFWFFAYIQHTGGLLAWIAVLAFASTQLFFVGSFLATFTDADTNLLSRVGLLALGLALVPFFNAASWILGIALANSISHVSKASYAIFETELFGRGIWAVSREAMLQSPTMYADHWSSMPIYLANSIFGFGVLALVLTALMLWRRSVKNAQ